MTMPVTGFSEDDFAALDEWLARRRVGICDISELEGFLVALVIGPNTVQPMTWLPKVWGGRKPQFRDAEEFNRFVALVMGYYNDLVLWFEHVPGRFRPTLYETKYEGRRIQIVDEWCVGFLKWMRLDAAALEADQEGAAGSLGAD